MGDFPRIALRGKLYQNFRTFLFFPYFFFIFSLELFYEIFRFILEEFYHLYAKIPLLIINLESMTRQRIIKQYVEEGSYFEVLADYIRLMINTGDNVKERLKPIEGDVRFLQKNFKLVKR